MASKTAGIDATIQRDLYKIINNAIHAKSPEETTAKVRETASDTILDVARGWLAYTHINDGTLKDSAVVDKTHFSYTAAHTLYLCRDQPDALPAAIVTWFTKQIKDERELTAGSIREILRTALKVEERQSKMAEADKRSEARALAALEKGDEEKTGAEVGEASGVVQQGKGKKRKVESAPENEVLDGVEGAGDPVSEPSKKKQKGAVLPTSGNAVSPAAGEDSESVVQVDSTAAPDLSAQATTSSPKPNGSPNKVIPKPQKPGPGNRNSEKGTKWYPDEDEWMKQHIAANMSSTFTEYAAANKAQFDGTYYFDEAGVQQPGMREGRTANALSLRFREYKKKLREEKKDGDVGQAAASTMAGSQGGSGAVEGDEGASEAAGGRQDAGNAVEGGDGTNKKKSVGQDAKNSSGNGQAGKTTQTSNSASGSVSGAPTTQTARDSTTRNDSDVVTIYVSGVGPPSTRGDYADAPDGNTDEPDDDENPLEDLDDVVKAVEEGDL